MSEINSSLYLRSDDLVAVPRELLAAACYAIANRAEAPMVLTKLREAARSPATSETLTAAEVEALKEYKILFEEAQLARDEAGFLGSVPDCIRYFADEIKHLEDALNPQPKPSEATP